MHKTQQVGGELPWMLHTAYQTLFRDSDPPRMRKSMGMIQLWVHRLGQISGEGNVTQVSITDSFELFTFQHFTENYPHPDLQFTLSR
jgi:hypothetical protein